MSWSVDIGGTNITNICLEIRWRPKLSRPASCVVRFPSHLFSCTTGQSEMHLSNGGLLFSGPVWFQEVTGDENTAYTEVTAYDHLIYLSKRMCKTPSSGVDYAKPAPPAVNIDHLPGFCNLADPSLVLKVEGTAPAIMATFLQATKDCDGSFPLNVGSVASGPAVDLSSVPADWPMDLATMAQLLLETGQLDILVSPGFGSSTVNLTNGGGSGGSGGSLNYATGSFNARSATKTEDMEDVINALWYLLDERQPQYDRDISHWGGSITPTAANAGGDGQGHFINGVFVNNPGQPWPGSLVSRWMQSRSKYGYMQEIQIHDSKQDESDPFVRPFYEAMYAKEAFLRAEPETFVGITPVRTTGGPPFSVGDSISASAGSVLGGGFSGSLRVYEFEITVDADGIGQMTDLITSDNQG